MSGRAIWLADERPLFAFLERRLRAPMLEPVLLAPLREFLARPGKQLRAQLVQLSWDLAGGHGDLPPELPMALELLHAGSLIVDDLEDGAVERRGSPALHLLTGLPVALNAGNWLYFAALELLDALPLDDHRGVLVHRRAHAQLARCHEGQALDVGVRIGSVQQGEVEGLARAISERKTGGLSGLSASLAAICAGAGPSVEVALHEFGVSLGLALQILDDCSAISCEARHEKGREDLENERVTWAWALIARKLDGPSYRALLRAPSLPRLREVLGNDGHLLGRRELQTALESLRLALGSSAALDRAMTLSQLLEQSYA